MEDGTEERKEVEKRLKQRGGKDHGIGEIL
jgi:hypothetical protein